jgi:peptide chain release factor 2
LAGTEKELAELERQSSDPKLWDDQRRAQELLTRAGRLRQSIAPWQELHRKAEDIAGLAEIAGDDDQQALADLRRDLAALQARLADLELTCLLSGPYDDHSAILSINAGAGGTEACDWVDMLGRMYLRWAERRGYQAEVIDRTPGESAGSKSITAALTGPLAYGYLKTERGVHRLVRISPFDASRRRHTTFASVDVIPEVQASDDVGIDPKEIEMDFFRASSAGGQHVNKTSSAVRIKHIPTGIVVTCQNERSQHRNREFATRVLKARLLELRRKEQEEKLAQMRGQQAAIAWGNQIRSYVLHPYNLVKDHRTDHETSNTAAVLDGEIDEFIQEYLEKFAARA